MSSSDDWKLIGRGGANLVYEYIGGSLYAGKVLRLRLKGSEISATEIWEYMSTSRFDPLRKWMLITDLVDPVQGLSEEIDPSQKGLMMPNLLVGSHQTVELNKYIVFHFGDTTLLELKPKWLYDASEPCRNCIQAMAKHQKYNNCTRQLLSESGTRNWAQSVQEELTTRGFRAPRLLEALLNCRDLFRALYQLQNDGTDLRETLRCLKSEQDVTPFIQFSMTLKDVTIMIDLDTGTAHLVDLDKKPVSKWLKWKATELALDHVNEAL